MSDQGQQGAMPADKTRLSVEDAVRQAYAHWNSRNVRQAEELALRVLAAAPNHPGALNLMSLISYSRGNLDQAIAQLQRACQAPNVPPMFFSNLGEMLRQRGQLGPAEEAARKAVATDGKLAGAWSNLGIILQEAGKLQESRDCLGKALALEPRNPEFHNNMGNTLKRLGDLHGAEQHWHQAIQLRPNYAEPHSNLSLLLIDQGQIEAAVASARRAIDLNPRLADAYVNLASAENARSRYGEALRALDALKNFAPNYVTGLCARALALKNLDRFDEAAATARRAVALAPMSSEAHAMLGQILQVQGVFEEALAAYDRAAELSGNARERALINRAVLYMEHARADEAEEAFERAVTEYPNSASAWFNRADLIKFRGGDASIDRMKAALGNGPRHQTDRMLLNFALGKAYLDIGESDKAFEHLNEANRLKRSTIAYNPDDSTRAMEGIAQVFGAELLAELADKGARSERPVFIVGMPRSGTTLIEQILASHPDVYGAGELRHVQHVVAPLRDFPQSIPRVAPDALRDMGERYLAKIPVGAGAARYVIDKMPANFFYAGLIRLILPDARIIHSRRDAADTCLSCYSKLFQSEQNFTYDLGELGRFHRDYQNLMAHWRTVLRGSHFIEVDYEAVVEDTEAEVRKLLNFLDLPWNDACLEFYRTERAVRTASVNQVRQPVYKSSAGRWRKHEAHLGPLLAVLGR